MLSWTSHLVESQQPESTVSKGKYRFVWLLPPKLFCYISPCDGSVLKGLQQKPIVIIIIISSSSSIIIITIILQLVV